MCSFYKRFLFLFIIQLSLLNIAFADKAQIIKTQSGAIELELIAEGLNIPWGIAFYTKDEILFTERRGNIGIASISSGKITKLKNPPDVLASGQGGLLDVALPPDYQTGDWIFFTYAKELDDKGVTTLARAKIKNNVISDWEDIFITNAATNSGRHFGSRIAFDDKGHLFFTVGDRADRDSAQDLMMHNGSVLRLNLDGSIPEDNPFVSRKNTLPAIWSYGHRNPQGIAYDRENNRLWVIEHGPRGGDEINLVQPGQNFGWPVISYGKEYWGPISVGEGTHKEGMEQPQKIYKPSIAPGSLMLYQGDKFPQWHGHLFTGALKLAHLNRIGVNAEGALMEEERLLEDLGERIRALAEGPDGYIYFSTDSGKIFRLKPLENQ